jgi:hypothetical protein
MRNRLIALGLLAILIAVAAVFFGMHRAGSKKPGNVPLTTLAPGAVTHLVVKKNGKVVLELRRRAKGWEMLAPKEKSVDTRRVRMLLTALEEPTARHYSAESLTLSNIGLDPPAYVMTANHTRLAFGTVNPATLLRYVRRGHTVYLVMDRIAPLLADPDSFITASAPDAGTAGG